MVDDYTQNTYDYHDIPAIRVRRVSTGFNWFDRSLGHTIFNNNIEYGLPLGATSVWSGGPGVGKTRVALSISSAITNNGGKVLFFQCESDLRQFRNKVDDFISCPRGLFLLSGFTDKHTMVSEIQRCQPTLVIIDSINMIDAFSNMDYCREIMTSFAQVAASHNCHIAFIGHLTKSGRTKGSADVEHLVDIVCDLQRCTPSEKDLNPNKVSPDVIERVRASMIGTFKFSIRKSRYGPGDISCYFRHLAQRIEFVSCTLPEFEKEQRKKEHSSQMGLPYNPIIKNKSRNKGGFWQIIGLG